MKNIRVSEDVVYRDLAGEVVVLDLATGTYFGLDAIGTRIWHVLVEHGSTEMVVRNLLGEFDVEKNQLRRDVENLIQQLAENGLVTIAA